MSEFQYETTWLINMMSSTWNWSVSKTSATTNASQMVLRWQRETLNINKITDRGSDETSPSKERVQQIWLKSLLLFNVSSVKSIEIQEIKTTEAHFHLRVKINKEIKHFVMLHITIESLFMGKSWPNG